VKSTYYILAGNWVVYSLFSVWENAGMPENYRLMVDYKYQGKKKEIHKLKYIVCEIYILSIRVHKTFFVCEYQLWLRLEKFVLMAPDTHEKTTRKIEAAQIRK
jgi:hypothetical protein